jgi:YidC/Oxa1 family membrane protein insertase
MEKNSTRYFLIFALVLIGIFLANAWQQDKQDNIIKAEPAKLVANNYQENELPEALPAAPTADNNIATAPSITKTINPEDLINISTNIFNIKIDRVGGDFVYLELKDYPEKYKSKTGFILLVK